MESLRNLFLFYLKKIGLISSNSGIIVLTYHGIVSKIIDSNLQRNFNTKQQFESHIDFFKNNNYKFLNANEFVHFIENPNEIKQKKLVFITFDDGYQNNLEAIKILNKHNLSGTFFITSDSINTNTSIWTVNLSLLLLKGSLNEISFNNKMYAIKTAEEKLISFREIRNYLKSITTKNKNLLFDEIQNQFPQGELESLIENNNYFKMLTWDEIRKVQSQNIQFHSHGHTHEIHHENQDEITLLNEISLSKSIIEEKLKTGVFLFAYPNGNFNVKSYPLLEKSGYKSAFILEKDSNKNQIEKFCVSRITPNGKMHKFKNQIL